MYVATNKIPHHRLWIGNTRPPVGMEGGYSPYALPFVSRSQISRNFGNTRDFSEEIAKKILLENEINIIIELNDGDASADAWGCDLTYDYVKINGDYRT